MKNEPQIEPSWLNKTNMAKSAGISTQAFDKWGVKPVSRIGKFAYFTVADVLANRQLHWMSVNQPNPTKEDIKKAKRSDDEEKEELPIDYEKYRLVKAQADAQEHKNEINKQIVVPVDFATFALVSVANEASGILDSLPLNILRKHPELSTLQQENIKRELAKAMNSLSRLGSRIPDLLDEYLKTTNN